MHQSASTWWKHMIIIKTHYLNVGGAVPEDPIWRLIGLTASVSRVALLVDLRHLLCGSNGTAGQTGGGGGRDSTRPGYILYRTHTNTHTHTHTASGSEWRVVQLSVTAVQNELWILNGLLHDDCITGSLTEFVTDWLTDWFTTVGAIGLAREPNFHVISGEDSFSQGIKLVLIWQPVIILKPKLAALPPVHHSRQILIASYTEGEKHS